MNLSNCLLIMDGEVSARSSTPSHQEGPPAGVIIERSVKSTKTGEKWTFTFSQQIGGFGKEENPIGDSIQIGYLVRYSDKNNFKVPKEGIDYTQFFAPLKLWSLHRSSFTAWANGRSERQVKNVTKLIRKLQVKREDLLGCEEAEHEFTHMLTHEFNVELPFMLALKKPTFTLNHLAGLITDALEYHCDLLKRYQSDDQAFTADLEDLNQKQWEQLNHSPLDLSNVEVRSRIAARMVDLLQSVITCQSGLKCIERLRELGMLEGGKFAAIQAQNPGPIREEYSTLHTYVESLQVKKQSELQICLGDYGVRKGERLFFQCAKRIPYDVTDFEDGFGGPCSGHGMRLRCLNSLANEYYLESAVAQMSAMRFGSMGEEHDKLGHFLLAYEQILKNDPSEGTGLSPHIQKSIGEMAMSYEIDQVVHSLFKSKGQYCPDDRPIVPHPSQNISIHLSKLDSMLKQAMYIFSKVPAAAATIDDGVIASDGNKLEGLWKFWSQTCSDLYGQSFNQYFGLEELLSPAPPCWSQPPEPPSQGNTSNNAIEAFSTALNLTIAQSGHAYRQSQEVTESQQVKVKTRGNPPFPLEANLPRSIIRDQSFEESRNEPIFQVRNAQLKLVKKLFSRPEDGEGYGQVQWKDLYNLMNRIGFRIENVGGSIIRFIPPNEAGIPFNEHRPHPETSMPAIKYRAFGQRLRERYGWDETWFARTINAE
uniref:Uncharacterized protein n=1 Tax=Kwoniella bestiolae CBS 10118 TaxID=1296100 RepID=A0A1B9FZ12_9TREE|nr:hypothetical protein I302_06995 [Kwoniella bestiolae CBS 10118]OCF24009.1 hypothetical protein I302_06995 [Kwoniella bestiolae CBS 10118]